MSVISFNSDDSHCFGGLLRQFYDSTKPDKERLSSNKGVHVTWKGNTTETLSSSDCGFNAIDDLMPYSIINTKSTKSYSVLRKYLEKMGY